MPEAVEQRVEQCYWLAEQYFARRFARPQISFALRGRAAGVAHLGRNLLRFNQQLYQENRADFLRQTVAHEVAHLIAYALYGSRIRPHGVQWQSIMQQVFELPAQRCHNYQLAAVKKTFYDYQCQCRLHELGVRRHRRVERGHSYVCRTCRQTLRFTGQSASKLVRN